MKKNTALIFLIFCALVASTNTQNNADAIIGVWQTGSGKAHVQIKKSGTTYYGHVVWLKNPTHENGKPKLDQNNPDINKRNNPILGLRIVLGFEYKGENLWENGVIYDPENGRTYSCKAELTSANTLTVRGYVGISLVGRTDNWTRISN